MEHFEKEKLFGALLGFKVGDRVKTRKKRWTWRRDDPPIYYWRYGVVTGLVPEPDFITGEDRVQVRFCGRDWDCFMKVSELVRCRRYVKSE